MKTSRFVFLVSFVLIIAAASLGYSWHTATHVRQMERRLENAETALLSHNKSLTDTTTAARLRSLEERVLRAELASSQAQLARGSGTPDSVGLEQRVQKIEKQIKPHLEVLPPYVPEK